MRQSVKMRFMQRKCALAIKGNGVRCLCRTCARAGFELPSISVSERARKQDIQEQRPPQRRLYKMYKMYKSDKSDKSERDLQLENDGGLDTHMTTH